MEKRIREIINENSGVTGVIVRDSFGKKIMINEEVIFPSASIIKLFILMALNKDEYNKKIELKKEDKVWRVWNPKSDGRWTSSYYKRCSIPYDMS